MERQIGWLVLKEDKVFTNTYECAAWYENVLVKAGRYPITVINYEEWSDRQVKGYSHSAYANLPGTITDDYFQSLYCGVPVGKAYDTKQNAGKASEHHYYTYLYDVAESVLEGKGEYELLPEFEAREIRFMWEDEEHTTHGVFAKED